MLLKKTDKKKNFTLSQQEQTESTEPLHQAKNWLVYSHDIRQRTHLSPKTGSLLWTIRWDRNVTKASIRDKMIESIAFFFQRTRMALSPTPCSERKHILSSIFMPIPIISLLRRWVFSTPSLLVPLGFQIMRAWIRRDPISLMSLWRMDIVGALVRRLFLRPPEMR